MRIFKVTDSFSCSETRLELAPSSLKSLENLFFVCVCLSLPFYQIFCANFLFKRLSKMYTTSYAITYFDIMEFEAEWLI